jgi:flagellar motor switch protein FliN/FliY
MATEVKTILKLRVPVIVQIARQRMPLENVLAIAPGSILEFEKSADDELDLLVNNKAIGKGNAVKVGENFGLRLTAIGTARQRVAALSGGGDAAQGDGASPQAGSEANPPAGEAPTETPAKGDGAGAAQQPAQSDSGSS